MTLKYIQDNLWYDLIITNADGSTSILHGNIDYVTEHIADGIKSEIVISNTQSSDLQEFVNRYNKEANGLYIEDFYRKIYAL